MTLCCGAGRQCHHKSIVRPTTVEVVNAHSVQRQVPGYEGIPKPFRPAQVYVKHLQCVYDDKGWVEGAELCHRTEAVDYSKEAGHGVEVCPQDGSSPHVWHQTEISSN